MEAGLYSGPFPEPLDIRLERRDTTPLPERALIRLQAIARGKDPSFNYRWLLYEDGRWHAAWHSGDTSDWQTPFDTELPAVPTRTLPGSVVREVRSRLRDADFLSQAPYQADFTVEDGTYYVVTARLNDQVHEVIFDNVYPPLIEYLDAIISTYG